MSRWPTTKNGLAIPPVELGYETIERVRGRTTNHHTYWTGSWYRQEHHTQLFRGLITHVNTLNRQEHAELHDRYSPPKHPKVDAMIDVLDGYIEQHGQLDIVRERKTNELYRVSPASWENIRKRVRP